MPFEISSSEKKGWFSPALLRKNVTRFWPIWAAYTVILFFALPVEIVVNGRRVDMYSESLMVMMVPMGAVFGLMAAMALFSYLMSPKACQMFHALPVRREGLFLTNWVTGLLFFLVPNLVIFLLSAVAVALTGTGGGSGLVLWVVTATAAPMFFFCFAVMCAMFTGNLLALPVFYGILNALVIGVCFLLDMAGAELLYNYSGMDLVDSTLARWCTPAYQIDHLLASGSPLVNGVTAAACYCVALGATFTLIAVLVYQHRQLERAGDLVTVGWVRPVFQFGFGACVGLSMGILLYVRFFYSFGPWAYIVAVAVCAVIGAFAGRMLLKKTLRVFADGWKGCFALGLAALAVMAGVRVDAFGFQRWTPDPDRVASVYIQGVRAYPNDDGRYMETWLTDPEDIAQVVELQRALNDHLRELQQSKEQGLGGAWDGNGYQTQGTVWLTLDYTMADGSQVSRHYPAIPIKAEALTDPETYAAKLTAFVNLPVVEGMSYWRDWYETPSDLKAAGGWVSLVEALPEEEKAWYYANSPQAAELVSTQTEGAVDTQAEDYAERSEVSLSGEEAQRLWDAFREDLDAGRVKRYLLDDEARQANCYYSDITISLTWTEIDRDGDRYTRSLDLTFTPERSQTSVMAVLEELGLKDRLTERELLD